VTINVATTAWVAINSLIHQGICIAPLQVYYCSEALPTQRGYCIGVSYQSTTGNWSEGLAQGPYVAARARFEPTALRTKGDESTNEPARPKLPITATILF